MRKAISPVIAELLLLAVTITLGMVVYAFASTSVSSFTSGFTNALSNQGHKVSEQIVVENVVFGNCPSASAQACLYVRNVGNVQVTVVDIYVTDQSSGAFVGTATTNTQISVGSFKAIAVQISGFAPVTGHAYFFKVDTSDGGSTTVTSHA